MRHRKAGRRLGRTTSHRDAMMRNMVTSLLEHGRITTTDPKAKELRGLLDRMVTLGKKDSLHARRMAARVIRSEDVVKKLFSEIAPGFAERHGGYTRIVKTRLRHGDGAQMSIIELMPPGPPETKGKPSLAPTLKSSVVPTTKEKFGADAG